MNSKFTLNFALIMRWSLIAVIILFILVLNFCSLREHMASNNRLITNYTLPEDYEERNRDPVIAGVFSVRNENGLRPKILIVPPADDEYSARVAAKAYLSLSPIAAEIKNVILAVPSSRGMVFGVAVPATDNVTTSVGKVKVNKKIIHALTENRLVKVFKPAGEKFLQTQVPFLQKVLPAFEATPFVYGKTSPEELAAMLAPWIKRKDTVVVFSADLSRYHEEIVERKNVSSAENEASACRNISSGTTGINAALILAKENGYQPEMLDLVNSGDAARKFGRITASGAWNFAEDDVEKEQNRLQKDVESLNDFRRVHGEELMNIAKETLNQALFDHDKYSPSRNDHADSLFDRGAAFVTLKKNGVLRGSAGSVVPARSIVADVIENTYAAAVADRKFPPLSVEELPEIDITISVLTGFEPVPYKNEDDLLSKFVPGQDGIVIRSGNRQAVSLPEVWKEIPDRQKFLNDLKLKAGMNPGYWSNRIKVYRFYTVEIN